MHILDWAVVAAYLVWMVWDGVRRTEDSDKVEGYLLANRSLPWWAVGLSVMATQLSAITLVGATGQGYADGMRFVQFYFGLPIAMIILSVTLVPFFYRARVYTAYEYLERRFDLKTRTLASVLFLCSRGLSCGVIIAAPAVILSIILGWNLTLTILAIGLPTAVYTMVGGVQAVTWTDVKQMVVIVVGLVAVIIALILGLPGDVSFGEAMHVAGAAGRLKAVDFRFDWSQTYTFWSGLLGGLFLMLSYFGCDQSQVQRYLTAKSVAEGRDSLMMSAFVKIPLQALVLLTGVLVFVFYLFQQPPMLFNRVHAEKIASSDRAAEFQRLDTEFGAAFQARRGAAAALADAGDGPLRASAADAFRTTDAEVKAIRARAAQLVREVTGDERYRDRTGDTPAPDVNYVFPTFVTTRLPPGMVGLIIAAIFAAAMSSIAAELNSLATSSVIDIYRRMLKPTATDAHYLSVSKLLTGFWGIVACVVAMYAAGLGSLIEVVNRFGSFFYGSLLGVFVLALGFKRATGTGAFVGLIAGMVVVALVALHPATSGISFLWHNPIGVIAVVVVGSLVSLMTKPVAKIPGMKILAGIAAIGMVLGAPQPVRYDVVIVGGQVVDGSGQPARRVDLAIAQGRIAAIGRIARGEAREVIDATGLIVAPGFIDVHTHADNLADHPLADNFVRMGVTTIIAGNCGSSALDVGEALANISRAGPSVNFATLIGHNTVRAEVMGTANRLPSIPDLTRMRSLVWRAMADGAVGLSTGLQYVPGTYANTPEIIDLARVAGNAGGVYATHMRNEGTALEAAVEESIRVGSTTGARVQISHLKVDSPSRWGASAQALAMIDAARSRGVDVMADQYAYTAASSTLGIRFPSWVLEGGQTAMAARLEDPQQWARIKREMAGLLAERGLKDLSFAVVASHAANPSLNGLTMAQAAAKLKGSDSADAQFEAARDLMLANGASMVYHFMSDDDVNRIMRHPFVAIASDASVLVAGQGAPHPRGYGNNARVLGEYVRTRHVIALEDAVRKMTSLPAGHFRLDRRGLLKEGYAADVIVFDAARVKDAATFEKPHAYAAGIPYVLVNGVVVVKNGEHTKARPGVAITRGK